MNIWCLITLPPNLIFNFSSFLPVLQDLLIRCGKRWGREVADCQLVAALQALCSNSLMLPVYLLEIVSWNPELTQQRICVITWPYFSVPCSLSVLLNSTNIMFLMILQTHKFASISYCVFGEHLDVMEVNMLQSNDFLLFLTGPVRASGIAFCGCRYVKTKNKRSLKRLFGKPSHV